MAHKWQPPPPNVHDVMVAYPDLENRDKNSGIQMPSKESKSSLVWEIFAKYMGTQIVLVHPKRDQLYYLDVDYRTDARGMRIPTPSCKIWIQHVLFGDWRLARKEDIERIEKKEQVAADGLARIEARRQALKAGLIFKEMADTAKTIVDSNAKAQAEADPTEADLDALQAKIDAARKSFKKPPKANPAKE